MTQRVKAGIARSFQLVNVFDDLTAFDNVALAIFSREGKTAHLGRLAHLDHAVTPGRPTPSSASSAWPESETTMPATWPRASASCSTWRWPTP